MIQSLFLIEWSKLLISSGKERNNTEKKTIDTEKLEQRITESIHIVFSYPTENGVLNNPIAINRIVELHTPIIKKLFDLSQNPEENNNGNKKTEKIGKNVDINIKNFIQIQSLFDYEICSCYILQNSILCLVFDKNDDVQTYQDIIIQYLEKSLLPIQKDSKKLNLSNLEPDLISLFVDIRIHGFTLLEESVFYLKDSQTQKKIENIYQNRIIKLYLYGIDSAGKTSFVRFLKTGKYDHNFFPPTKKFLIHNLTLPNLVKVVIWEMPGQKTLRRVWLQGIKNSNLLIFMLDAADKSRFPEVKRSFWSIADHFEVKDCPIIIIANKIDLVENKRELAEIENILDLSKLKDRNWVIKFISLVSKEGIKDVIDWISKTLHENLLLMQSEENTI